MSAGKETPEQKAIRLLNAAFRIKEPFNFDKPPSNMYAVSLFNIEKLIELAIAEEREANGWQPIETAPKDGTSLGEIEMIRGTGRTTKQMKEAPQNAVFIWGTSGSIEYAVDLARRIGREDLQIKTPVWLKDNWQGLKLSGVVVDHAAPLSSEQAEGLQRALVRIGMELRSDDLGIRSRCRFPPSQKPR